MSKLNRVSTKSDSTNILPLWKVELGEEGFPGFHRLKIKIFSFDTSYSAK